MKGFCATLLALTVCMAAGEAGAGLLPPGDHNRIVRSFEPRPMIFFVARGPADSCGKGCSEWIAAAGVFDDGSPERLRGLIDKLGDRNLPIFFHSAGGSTGAGARIGIILRERRMTAGVGRTDASCRVFDKKDKACQNRIAGADFVTARLTMSDAACFSACVEAFVGAASRRVAPAARLGVHAARMNLSQKEMQLLFSRTQGARATTAEDFQQASRRYYVEMGVSPEVPEFASKIPHSRIYVLDRDEIVRFGLESRSESYATPWITSQMPGTTFIVIKSVTRRSDSNPAENLTTRLILACGPDRRPIMIYRRDLSRDPDQATTFSRVSFDQSFFEFSVVKTLAGEETGAFVSPLDQETLKKFSAAKTLTLTERMNAGSQKVLETKFSNAGLAEALVELQKRCLPSASLPATSVTGIETIKPEPAQPVKPGFPSWMPTTMPRVSPQTPGYSPNPNVPTTVTFKTRYRTSTPVTRPRTSSNRGAPRVVWVKEPWAIAAKPRVYYSNPGSQNQR